MHFSAPSETLKNAIFEISSFLQNLDFSCQSLFPGIGYGAILFFRYCKVMSTCMAAMCRLGSKIPFLGMFTLLVQSCFGFPFKSVYCFKYWRGTLFIAQRQDASHDAVVWPIFGASVRCSLMCFLFLAVNAISH